MPAFLTKLDKLQQANLCEEESKKIVRPAAKYDNIPSPFGFATEMLQEQLKDKKTG